MTFTQAWIILWYLKDMTVPPSVKQDTEDRVYFHMACVYFDHVAVVAFVAKYFFARFCISDLCFFHNQHKSKVKTFSHFFAILIAPFVSKRIKLE